MLNKVIAFYCIVLSFHTTAQPLLVDGNHSVDNLNPWLSIQLNDQFVKLLDVIDTIEVQHSYTFKFYVKNSTSEKVSYHLMLGNRVIFADWISIIEVTYHNPKEILVVHLEAEQELIIQFRLKELDRMDPRRLHPQLLTQNDFLQRESGGKLFQPFFLGIFLFMVFFNMFYFLISRWTVYLKYAVYILLSLIFFSFHFGFLQLIFPALTTVSSNLVWILSSSIAASYTLFISDFGEFKKLNPKAYRIFKIVLTFKYIQLPTEVFLWLIHVDFIHSQLYLKAVMSFEVPFVLLGFYYLLISPLLRSRIILTASFILLSGSVIGQLNPFPGIDQMVIIEIGTLIEILIFSISLALKAKEIDNNRILVTEQLLEKTMENIKIQEKISADLEQQVQERTLSLVKKNKENELLMTEIHHRVKNNLQIISSLINLKARHTLPETYDVLEQLNHKIFSLGLVYEKLHKSGQLNQISLDEYITEIGEHLTSSLNKSKNPITIKLDCDPIILDPERALACGLIANELITNAIKYAFKQLQPNAEIRIRLKCEENLISYSISDNGMMSNSTPLSLKKSFGLRFVEQLVVTKLKGEWFIQTESGFHVAIKFPVDYE